MKSELSNSPYGQYWHTSRCNLVGWVYRHHEISWPRSMYYHRIRGHSLLGNEAFHRQSWSQFTNENRNVDSIHIKHNIAHYKCVLNTIHIRIVGLKMSVSTVPLKQRNHANPIEMAPNLSGSLQCELKYRPTWSYKWMVLNITIFQTQINGNLHQIWGACLCHWRVELSIHINEWISGDTSVELHEIRAK